MPKKVYKTGYRLERTPIIAWAMSIIERPHNHTRFLAPFSISMHPNVGMSDYDKATPNFCEHDGDDYVVGSSTQQPVQFVPATPGSVTVWACPDDFDLPSEMELGQEIPGLSPPDWDKLARERIAQQIELVKYNRSRKKAASVKA